MSATPFRDSGAAALGCRGATPLRGRRAAGLLGGRGAAALGCRGATPFSGRGAAAGLLDGRGGTTPLGDK